MKWIMYKVWKTHCGKQTVSAWSKAYATRDELLQNSEAKRESHFLTEKGDWYGFLVTVDTPSCDDLHDPGFPNRLERYDP